MWARFYQNFKKDFRLWLYLVVLQQLCRGFFIFSLKRYLAADVGFADFVLTIVMGLRYDSLWATIALFAPLALVSLPATFIRFFASSSFVRNFRWIYAIICSCLIVAFYIVSIEYYFEYHDIFNQFLFGLIYDDTRAIFQTIWAQDYLLKYFIISIFALTAIIYTTRKFLRKSSSVINKPWWIKIPVTCLIVIFYIGAFRGGLGPRPIQMKDAAAIRDPFLSKAVISPFSGLKYALKQRRLISQNDYGKQFLENKSILELLHSKYPQQHALQDFDSYLVRQASGMADELNIPRAKHVFVIVGESYDAWALQPSYKDLKLTTQLQALATNGGVSIEHFLPSADGTIAALNTIMTGLLETEIMINYQANSIKAYPTAPAIQFKRMGYQTNFFYGGYLSWQKVGDLAAAQGFDNVYGAPHMGSWVKTTEWGVDDRELYNFILNTIENDVPSYNLIMTTSNHPPFRVDLIKEGCDLANIEKQLINYPNSPATAIQLGHLWYADKTLGEFVRNAENKFNTTLFVITGDHYGRRHVLPNPPTIEAATVPFVLYGKNITDKLKFNNAAGSHVDIGPTLVELVAPSGFEYHALGNNLFSKNADYGINKNFIISKSGIIHLQSNPEGAKDLLNRHAQYMGLSWWRVVKGNTLN